VSEDFWIGLALGVALGAAGLLLWILLRWAHDVDKP